MKESENTLEEMQKAVDWVEQHTRKDDGVRCVWFKGKRYDNPDEFMEAIKKEITMKGVMDLQRRCHEIEKRINRLHRVEEKLKKERASLLWQMSAYYQETSNEDMS